jgi:hypothetical protein
MNHRETLMSVADNARRDVAAVIRSTLRALSERETHELSKRAGVAREMLRACADDREPLSHWATERIVLALWSDRCEFRDCLLVRERRRPRLVRNGRR